MNYFKYICIITNIIYCDFVILNDDRIYTEGVYYIDENTNQLYTNSIVIKFNCRIINSDSENNIYNRNDILPDYNYIRDGLGSFRYK
jgi:hypothetical protein